MTSKAARKPKDDIPRPVPIIEFAGGIPILLPMPSDYLPERHLDALRAIEAEVARGRKTMAQRLALDLEKRLGITMDDRIAALRATSQDDVKIEGALIRAAATSAQPELVKRRKRSPSPFDPIADMAAPDRAMVELPAGERGRSKDDVRRWERSRQALINPAKPLSDAQKDSHADAMAEIEGSPARRQHDADLAHHLDARAANAKAQGHRVERASTGRVNVVDWDALKSLGQTHLSPEEVDVAAAFKALYEARAADAGALDYTAVRGSGVNPQTIVAKGAERAFACAKIGDAERRIAMRCADEPSALQMFRAVLDHNIAISNFGEGRAFYRHVKALRRAIAQAAGVLRGKD